PAPAVRPPSTPNGSWPTWLTWPIAPKWSRPGTSLRSRPQPPRPPARDAVPSPRVRTPSGPPDDHEEQTLMAAVQDVTDADFEQVVLKSDKPVLVDYWADWCSPCKQISPIIEELAKEYGDKITFVKMDTNTNPVTPATHHVMGLPTLQVYDKGELVKAFQGAKSKSALIKALEEYL